MFARVLKTLLQLHLLYTFSIKNLKISHTNTKDLFKDLLANTLRQTYFWFPATLTKRANQKIHSFARNFFKFPLDSSFSPFMSFFVKTFSLYQKKVIAPLNIDWLARSLSHKILVGSFEFNRKLDEVLLTACD